MSNLKKYLKVYKEDTQHEKTFEQYMRVISENDNIGPKNNSVNIENKLDDYANKEIQSNKDKSKVDMKDIGNLENSLEISKNSPNLVIKNTALGKLTLKDLDTNYNNMSENTKNSKSFLEQYKDLIDAVNTQAKTLSPNKSSTFTAQGNMIKTFFNEKINNAKNEKKISREQVLNIAIDILPKIPTIN